MSGKSILIVGTRGTGKSTTARELIQKVHPKARLIYDINNEHKDLYPEPLLKFEDFTAKLDRLENGVCFIDEATIFLSNRGNNFDVKEALVKARHNNNTFLMSFHSLRSIPRYVFDLSDYIYLHKTNDTSEVVEKFDNPRLLKYFDHIRAAAWNVNNETGKRYSPRALFAIND